MTRAIREARGLIADRLVWWAFRLDPERFAEDTNTLARQIKATGAGMPACRSGKRIYWQERLANRAVTEAAKRGELPQMRHYKCPECSFWHLARKHRSAA